MSQRFNPGSGVDRYVDAGTVSLASTTAFTFCGWVYLTTGGVNGDVIYADPVAGAFTQYAWVGWDSGNWVFLQNNAGNSGVYNYSTALTTGAWTHLAMVFDGTNTLSYINGALVNSAASNVGARGAFNLIAIGVNSADATLQDCKVFASALDAAAVAREMRVSRPARTAFIWWPLFAGSPGTADLSGNGRNLSGLGNSDGVISAPCAWGSGSTQLLFVPASGSALIGVATSAVSSSATATTAAAISGSGTASVSASGTLTAASALVGTATVGCSASGALTVSAAIVGTAQVAVSASGALNTAGLVGVAQVAVASSATATVAAALAGTAQAACSASGTLTTAVALGGSAQVAVASAGTLSTGGTSLVGTQTTGVSASGTLTAVAQLVGSSLVQVAAQAVVDMNRAMLGSASVSVSSTGLASVLAELTGSALVRAAAGATLSLELALSGSASVGVSAAGTLTESVSLSGSSVTGVSASGTLQGVAPPVSSGLGRRVFNRREAKVYGRRP